MGSCEMPRYECHKKVWALKILMVWTTPKEQGALLTPVEDGYAPFWVDGPYVVKHRPQVGGYYVVYSDGYKSFSPAAAFESGYTRVA